MGYFIIITINLEYLEISAINLMKFMLEFWSEYSGLTQKRDEKMNNTRNVIVMFLFIVLSFAIISEVSATSDAGINGTGSDHPIESIDMSTNDVARENDNFMQDPADDLESINEQKSFDKSPRFDGDNMGNENLYEHDMDKKPNGDRPFEFDHDNKGPLEGNNSLGDGPRDVPNDDENKFNSSDNLRDDKFLAVHKNGEAKDDVMSKFNDSGKNNPKPIDKNVSDAKAIVNKNTSKDQLPMKNSKKFSPIKNNTKKSIPKNNAKKTSKNTKSRVNPKVKSPKQVKKVNMYSIKKIKKGMAKL